ncbi:MAG: hypothetical protein HY332_06525 [Chloroflexi bacterium]|nr:hypothetical protein [Chloroflexota bacterium]
MATKRYEAAAAAVTRPRRIYDQASVNSVSPLRAFFESKEWQGRVKDLPVLRTIQQIAELPGVYPYRRYGEQNEEITPIPRDAFLGKEDIKNALQKSQAIAERVLAS